VSVSTLWRLHVNYSFLQVANNLQIAYRWFTSSEGVHSEEWRAAPWCAASMSIDLVHRIDAVHYGSSCLLIFGIISPEMQRVRR
jgi:hypothetical protein